MKGVAKAPLHVAGEGEQLFLRQAQGRHYLIAHDALDELANLLVGHGLAHRVEPGQEGDRHQGGVGAVEDGDLALLVGLDVIDDEDVERLPGGQLIEAEGARQPCRPLDHQQVEVLGGDHELILIAKLRLQLGVLVPGKPVTMRSTRVEQKVLCSRSQVWKASGNCHWAA